VKVESFITAENYLKKIHSHAKGEEKVIYPIIIHSSSSGITFTHTITMNNEVESNKVLPRN
jgi:hypothetical protein